MCVWIKVKGKSIAMHLLPQTIPQPEEKDHIGNWKKAISISPQNTKVAMEIFILLRLHCY